MFGYSGFLDMLYVICYMLYLIVIISGRLYVILFLFLTAEYPGDRDGLSGEQAVRRVCVQQPEHNRHLRLWRVLLHVRVLLLVKQNFLVLV